MANTALKERKNAKQFVLDHIIEFFFLLIVIILAFTANNFMTWGNWSGLLRNLAPKGVIAFGMTMVIIAGQIDLSVGSTIGLAGVIVARMSKLFLESGMDQTLGCILGILVVVACSLFVGFYHTISQHKFGMQAFIVALVSLNLLFGVAGVISKGFPISNAFPQWFRWLSQGDLFGFLPVPVVIMLIVFAATLILMNYTTIGRSIYASGGNPESARLSGINVFKSKFICFFGVQLMASLGGIMFAATNGTATHSNGKGYEVDIISSVVIGGTSMLGGIGTVWGTLIGILFIGVMSNGMTIFNIDTYVQYVVRALLMYLAVLISTYRTRSKA